MSSDSRKELRERGLAIRRDVLGEKYVDAAMALDPRIGPRVDCLGELNMFSLLPTAPLLQERWKTAPVLSPETR